MVNTGEQYQSSVSHNNKKQTYTATSLIAQGNYY